LDYDKHCAVPSGAYEQANHKTNQTNSNTARTIDAIYLQPALKMQGGHELYDLNSNRVITQARASQISITDLVIKAIEKIAEDQGFKSLKFKNRKGAIFHNADWIAGVDYDETIQQDTDDDKAYEHNENGDQEQDKEIDEEYDQTDVEELADLSKDQWEQDNPYQHREDEGQGKVEAKGEEEQSDDSANKVILEQETTSQGSEPRRSARES
jgi:thiamine phosphate synthase YjbQ (UPF0047 family)